MQTRSNKCLIFQVWHTLFDLTPSQCWGQSPDRGSSSRTQSFYFFLFYKYTTWRRMNTNHHYIQKNLITSGGAPCPCCPHFQSIWDTFSSFRSNLCVCVCVYSNTVCLRADSTFAYTHCCLVYFCMNATQRFFQATVKGVTYSMWNFIIVYHTGMCVKLHQHGTRQLQHNTRK